MTSAMASDSDTGFLPADDLTRISIVSLVNLVIRPPVLSKTVIGTNGE